MPDRTSEGPDPRLPDFSLAEGGALDRFLRWARLSAGISGQAKLRMTVIALLAWLPLLLLSAADGSLLGVGMSVPFLMDVEVHVRLLVALPLLIFAEVEVHRRIPPLLRQFPQRGLIPGVSIESFEAAVLSARRLRDSVLAEALLICAVYGFGIFVIWRNYVALDTDTWYATVSPEGVKLTLAGMWYAFVSVPIFQFLLLRWYFRLFVWARLLWQVSRIRLLLITAHPDRSGGLGFLSTVGYAFGMLALAHGALAAGHFASLIFYDGAALPDFAVAVVLLVVVMLCLVLVPLLVFSPQLADLRQQGLLRYGALADRYVREFEAKWLSDGAPDDATLLGSGDVQSLADMGGSYEIVQSMRVAPITKQAILRVVMATLLPILPLLLTMVSFDEFLKGLVGLVF